MLWTTEKYDPNDPLNVARGVANGLLLSAIPWGIIIVIIGIVNHGG